MPIAIHIRNPIETWVCFDQVIKLLRQRKPRVSDDHSFTLVMSGSRAEKHHIFQRLALSSIVRAYEYSQIRRYELGAVV